jgi:hypothetical protein
MCAVPVLRGGDDDADMAGFFGSCGASSVHWNPPAAWNTSPQRGNARPGSGPHGYIVVTDVPERLPMPLPDRYGLAAEIRAGTGTGLNH